MRQHYVAFSRVQNLLNLTAGEPPAPHFDSMWEELPRRRSMGAAARDPLLSRRFGAEHGGGAPSQSNLVIHRVQRLVVRAVPLWRRAATVEPDETVPTRSAWLICAVPYGRYKSQAERHRYTLAFG